MDLNQAEFLCSKIPAFRRYQPWDSCTDLLIDEIFNEYDERWLLHKKVLPDFDVKCNTPTRSQLLKLCEAFDKFRVMRDQVFFAVGNMLVAEIIHKSIEKQTTFMMQLLEKHSECAKDNKTSFTGSQQACQPLLQDLPQQHLGWLMQAICGISSLGLALCAKVCKVSTGVDGIAMADKECHCITFSFHEREASVPTDKGEKTKMVQIKALEMAVNEEDPEILANEGKKTKMVRMKALEMAVDEEDPSS
ncbi:uncharacterized protein BJ212DRAFT_1301328 [Suillus subaureus]|uniref:Uncharacterized protein n=1 Tax=Suillus subaureus TaxID=48587 RepID=A0A9P7E6U6_9AGAM|nr:uncharacterized protein BJ212DRAFT_1301328 [Suillus subaureus]KAG1812853.1 hypothetical protein BJ212DRAFT_1301328 [Suillus subaureus]